jgi:AraC-like DNA-binding protein
MDLPAGYRELAPPPAVAGAVVCLWLRVGGAATRVLPDACSDVIWRLDGEPFVAGPDTGPQSAAVTPDSVLIGARLAPGAGGAALGLPLSEVRNSRVELAEVDRVLAERLGGDLDPAVALSRLATVAAQRVLAAPPDPLVGEAARRLRRPGARVDGLAGELGVSERQLRRRCHAAAGYGPKTLHRVLRFRAALQRLDAGEPLAAVAAAAGYADQAHLTRECTRLAGLAPAALARERAA